MGVCTSSEEKQRDLVFEKNMKEAQAKEAMVSKLLLLGTGESGKSTLFKQMTAIYGKGFTKEYRLTFKPTISNGIIQSIQTLLEHVDRFGGPIAEDLQAAAAQLLDYEGTEKITEQLAGLIYKIWKIPAIQNTFENRAQFQLTDASWYFFERLMGGVNPTTGERTKDIPIWQKEYIPTDADVLRARVRTTGIVELEFGIDNNTLKMFDVGGQRNERKKWIHCFQGVTCVLFIGVLSEYNQRLFEDDETNRMEETVKLFQDIVMGEWFCNTSCVLFLNKCDLFAQKIRKYKLTEHCPLFKDYPDTINEYGTGCTAITELFLSKNTSETRQIYPHIVCATDTDMVQKIFKDIKSIIVLGALHDAGLLPF